MANGLRVTSTLYMITLLVLLLLLLLLVEQQCWGKAGAG
jgi:hypothetical protein